MIWTIILFLVLVVIPAVMALNEIPFLLKEAKKGWKGVVFVPISFTILIGTAVGALYLSQELTFLQWGWLGHNIIFGPSGPEDSAIPLIAIAPFVLLVAFLFNYYEEDSLYRDTWKGVSFWAILHLVMGIPLFAIIPIFSAGVVYKTVYDRRGQQEAFVTHFGTNTVLVSLAVALTVIG